MPQNSSRTRQSSTPPEVMTWRKASLILILAVVFDVTRAFFQFFWFFGPALAAAYCAMKAAGILSTWTLGILGAKTAAALCAGAAAAAGAAAIAATAPIGVILAEAVGLIGFLTLGLIVIMTNARIVKSVASAPWYFAGAFAFGEVPFLGALPVFSITLWRLYRSQIHAETAALKAWERERADQLKAERDQQGAAQAAQQAESVQMGEQNAAANEEQFAEQEQREKDADGAEANRIETEAANDDSYRQQSNG